MDPLNSSQKHMVNPQNLHHFSKASHSVRRVGSLRAGPSRLPSAGVALSRRDQLGAGIGGRGPTGAGCPGRRWGFAPWGILASDRGEELRFVHLEATEIWINMG